MSGTDHVARVTHTQFKDLGCRSAVAHGHMEHMERTTHHGNVGQMEHMDRVAGTNRSHALSLLLLLLGYSKMCGECMCNKGRFRLVQFTWISGALDADCTWIIGALDADCIVTRVAGSVALCHQIILVIFFKRLGVHRTLVVTLECVLGLGFSFYIA